MGREKRAPLEVVLLSSSSPPFPVGSQFCNILILIHSNTQITVFFLGTAVLGTAGRLMLQVAAVVLKDQVTPAMQPSLVHTKPDVYKHSDGLGAFLEVLEKSYMVPSI